MFEQVQEVIDRSNFSASNCAAQIFTYVPVTFIFSLNYLTNGGFRDESSKYYEGKVPAYFTFMCLIFSLSMYLYANYQNHPDTIDLEEEKLEQKEAAMTMFFIMHS